MTKQIIYKYLGTNGIIVSPVHLEGIYSVKTLRLVADKDNVLTKDMKTFVFTTDIPLEEEEMWQEVSIDNK